MAAARAKIVHRVPGRIRFQVPSARGNSDLLNKIKQSIVSAEGVKSVEVHPTTGSVIVHYRAQPGQKGKFRDVLEQRGQSSGLFDLAPPVPDVTGASDMYQNLEREAEFLAQHSELARTVVNTTEELNAAIKRATDNNLDLKVLVPGVMAVYAALCMGAEFSTPLWVTLGIFSFNSFVALHPPVPPAIQVKGHNAQ